MKPTDVLRALNKLDQYQVIIDGMPVSILELTRPQLLTEFAKMMDLMEDLDQVTGRLDEIMKKYRS